MKPNTSQPQQATATSRSRRLCDSSIRTDLLILWSRAVSASVAIFPSSSPTHWWPSAKRLQRWEMRRTCLFSCFIIIIVCPIYIRLMVTTPNTPPRHIFSFFSVDEKSSRVRSLNAVVSPRVCRRINLWRHGAPNEEGRYTVGATKVQQSEHRRWTIHMCMFVFCCRVVCGCLSRKSKRSKEQAHQPHHPWRLFSQSFVSRQEQAQRYAAQTVDALHIACSRHHIYSKDIYLLKHYKLAGDKSEMDKHYLVYK